MGISAKQWLTLIHEMPISQPIKIMNVCGGHERSITMSGIRGALPKNIELIPGPGCPVCICPEEDIYQAIQLSLHEDIILVAYGDMLRVPVNVKKSEARTLEQAKAAGARIKPIASPMDVIQIAEQNPDDTVVFFAAGFETTTAPTAAMIAQGVPDNLKILLSGRLTWPAIHVLLSSDSPGFNALVAPGHVATIMGPQEWAFVVEDFNLPAAVAGFSPESLLAATYSVIRQFESGKPFLDNCYPEVVKPTGNVGAQKMLSEVMTVVDATWRGVGTIPKSGFALSEPYRYLDVNEHFPGYHDDARKRAGEMPPGCDCAKVVMGEIYPNECRLYGKACVPRHPIGPCMVSDEGACRIWWAHTKR
ncbi:MAG: hydrogenase formation protein HypD [Methylococcales bacterium]|jgi:hydrogenase expression/formation protein HypD|nr:hydrogenase formation protein HypD [Methylococcales bacterium]MBT7445113.1 hydrogenase formation protein HypD [Methylococcales bacterium]